MMKKRLAVVVMAMAVAGLARAQAVTLAWDAPTSNVDGSPVTDLAGYKLYCGVTSRTYSTMQDVGNVTTAVFNLPTLAAPYWAASNMTLAYTRTTITVTWQGPVFPSNRTFVAATAYNLASNESDFSAELVLTQAHTVVESALVWSLTPGGVAAGTNAAQSLTGWRCVLARTNLPPTIIYARPRLRTAEGVVRDYPTEYAVDNRRPLAPSGLRITP